MTANTTDDARGPLDALAEAWDREPVEHGFGLGYCPLHERAPLEPRITLVWRRGRWICTCCAHRLDRLTTDRPDRRLRAVARSGGGRGRDGDR